MKTVPDRLLVVDDDPFNRDMLSRRLARKGYAVTVAEHGNQALALIQERPFDLVLLDNMMPGLSGIEVLKLVRATFPLTELPVIMVTAQNESANVVEALNNGANDFITKPVDFPVAVARISAQLSRKTAEEALRQSEERYALAVKGANDGLWDWDLRCNRVYFSPRWKSMLGYEESEIVDSLDAWLARVHPDDREHLESGLSAHRAGNTHEFECEHRILHKDGGWRWMLSRGVAVRGPSGKAHRMAGSQTDITENKVSDALTGLPNRISFSEIVTRAIQRSRRDTSYRFAVLFLDLDRFKVINDSLGHIAGDRMLVRIAKGLKLGVRADDTVARLFGTCTVARLGGDEFAILLEDMDDPANACQIAERIQKALSVPFILEGREVFTTVSIGVALSAADYQNPEEMLRDADTAMYRAKALGRARCEVFDSEMRAQAVARLELETDLRKALERQEFVLQYQPEVLLETGRIIGFEALVRWQHPTRGLISPGEFIPVAEETGLIPPLGRWVLNEACRQMREWRRRFPLDSSLAISVNVSIRQFTQPDLVEQIAEILHRTGLDASNLQLEITESVLMEEVESAVAVLLKLKAMNIGLNIDDFGTGYSSLKYLHRLPCDTLKIDRSFVIGMGNAGENSSIVRTILTLAHSLGMQVVAEGVETIDQLRLLRSMGCRYGQGYYFSRPIKPAAVEVLLESSCLVLPGAKNLVLPRDLAIVS